jgi:hypothetical protein
MAIQLLEAIIAMKEGAALKLPNSPARTRSKKNE